MSWNNNENPWENDKDLIPIDNNDALDWDGEIEEESEFVLLPEGEYSFMVTGLNRGRFEGSEKMSPCPKAELELLIIHDDKDVKVFENLFLHKKAEWKLSEFFISIGQKKHGEPLKMDWSKVIGSEGTCRIYNNEYNGNKYNRVKKFLEPKA